MDYQEKHKNKYKVLDFSVSTHSNFTLEWWMNLFFFDSQAINGWLPLYPSSPDRFVFTERFL